jgi:hypothetical protein
MLQMHQRHVYNTFDPAGDDIDLRRSFPRLVMLSVDEPSEHIQADDTDWSLPGISISHHPRHIELFQSVTFDELPRLLLPVSSGDMNVVAIYGTLLANARQRRYSRFTMVDIISLVIKKGAGLLPPRDGSAFVVHRRWMNVTST